MARRPHTHTHTLCLPNYGAIYANSSMWNKVEAQLHFNAIVQMHLHGLLVNGIAICLNDFTNDHFPLRWATWTRRIAIEFSWLIRRVEHITPSTHPPSFPSSMYATQQTQQHNNQNQNCPMLCDFCNGCDKPLRPPHGNQINHTTHQHTIFLILSSPSVTLLLLLGWSDVLYVLLRYISLISKVVLI